MAQQYSNPQPTPLRVEREEPVVARADVASPAPLGLNALAFATAMLGCYYTGFIVPYEAPSIRSIIGPFLVILGIILVLAGMWDYRKNYMVHATVFTSYGGFLAALGVVFMPNFGIIGAISGSGNLHWALGLFFLCWTIFSGIVFFGTLRTSASMGITMLVLFAAYLLLTIGQLAGNDYVLVHIGGWIAIATAIIAWLAGLGSIMTTTSALGSFPFRLPFSRRLVVVE